MWHVVPKYFKLPEIPLGTWTSCHCVGSLTSVTTRWQVWQQDQQDQPRLQDLESLSTQATATLPSFLRNFENLPTPHRLLILVSFLQSIYFDLHIFQCIFVTQPVKSSNVQSAVFHLKHSKSKPSCCLSPQSRFYVIPKHTKNRFPVDIFLLTAFTIAC